MKKNLFTIAAGVAFVSAVSCSVEEKNLAPETDLRVPMEFTAGIGTKTQLNPDHSVVWSEDDVISIFDGEYNNDFTINGEGGAASATFTGKALPDAAVYYALYPHSADAKLIDNVISSTLPSEQTVTAEATFATMVNPSVAVAAENSLTFKNIASILQVNVWNLAEGQKVTGISAKADKSLAGAYTVNPSASEPAAVASGSENTGVSLAGEIIDLNADGQYSYSMVVFPGSYNDLTVTVTYSDGSKSTFTASSAVDMPVSDGRTISIDASQAEAPAEETLYDKFMAGEDIEIAGKVYNKAKFGDAQLITENTELTTAFSNNTAAIFIEGDVVLTWSLEAASKNVMIVGNDPDKKSKVVLNQYIRCNAGGDTDAEFVMYNVDVDATQYTNNYLIFNNTSIPTSFRVIDSKLSIGDQRVFRATDDRAWNIIEFSGSTVNVTKSTTRPLIHADGSTGTFTNIIFRNNVLYSASGIVSTYNIFNSSGNVTVEKVVMENNTIINLHDEGAGLFRNYEYLNEVELKNNLLYVDEHATNAKGAKTDISFFRPLAATQIVQSEDDPVYVGNPEKGICDKSYFFVKESSDSNLKRTWFFGGMTRVNLTNETEFESVCGVDPFVSLDINNENFDVKDEYASYGAQR